MPCKLIKSKACGKNLKCFTAKVTSKVIGSLRVPAYYAAHTTSCVVCCVVLYLLNAVFTAPTVNTEIADE